MTKICLGIGVVFIKNILVNFHGLIKIIIAAKMICSIVKVRLAVIIEL